jgi:hypothetical protein
MKSSNFFGPNRKPVLCTKCLLKSLKSHLIKKEINFSNDSSHGVHRALDGSPLICLDLNLKKFKLVRFSLTIFWMLNWTFISISAFWFSKNYRLENFRKSPEDENLHSCFILIAFFVALSVIFEIFLFTILIKSHFTADKIRYFGPFTIGIANRTSQV